MKLSNTTVIMLLDLATIALLALPFFFTGMWLSNKDCEDSIINPFHFIAMSYMLTLACVAISPDNKFIYYLHFFLIFIVFLALLTFTLLAFDVTSEGGEGHVVGPGNNNKKYSLGDYSYWFQNRVNDSYTWESVKSCLVKEKYCKKVGDSNTPQDVFFKKHLSPIQSGCCKPPENCGFEHIGPTNWTKTGTPTNPDCNAWDNNPNTFCYDCTSCKAGFVHNFRGDLKNLGAVNAVFLGLLVAVYFIGCCFLCYNRWVDGKSRIHGAL